MVSMKQVVSVATLPVHVGDGPKGKSRESGTKLSPFLH